jgi:spore germination protein KA/spore germination protein
MRVLRFIALFCAFSLSALYVCIISFHNDMLPAEYIITVANLSANVPFNAFTSIIFLEITLETLREAILRIPKILGQTIGIVGAIIIGQAAVSSGVFSSLSLIFVTFGFLASFVAPDYTIMNPFRILKFFMIMVSAMFGLFGYALGFCFIFTMLISENSFGVAYYSPDAPFNLKDFIKSFFYNKAIYDRRPDYLKTKDDKMK